MKSLIKVENKIINIDSSIKIANKLLNLNEGLPDLIPYRKGDKWGFCDRNKRILIECIYDSVRFFNEGLSMVSYFGKVGFIDGKGNQKTPLIYEDASDFSEGLAAVKLNGRWGVVDEKGEQIIRCIYDSAIRFSEGLACVKLNGKWGFVDKKGNCVIYFIYDEAEDFSKGLAVVKLGGKWGSIDTNGNSVISAIYEDKICFSEGLACVNIDGCFGFIDEKGNLVIPAIYNNKMCFSEGLAVAELNGYVGYIDRTGKTIIEFRYPVTNRNHFKDGRVFVFESWKEPYKISCIDQTGTTLFSINNNYAFLLHNEIHYSEGFAKIFTGKPSFFKWGFIDLYGRNITHFDYDLLTSFKDGIAFFEANGKSGALDKNGQIIIPAMYDCFSVYDPFDECKWICAFNDAYSGLYFVRYFNKPGYIDKKGTQYWED
jgi:hypothetical protein